jgi:glycerol-3-phosphate acyltransferase PlsY
LPPKLDLLVSPVKLVFAFAGFMAAGCSMSWTETIIGAGVSPQAACGAVLAAYALGCLNTGYYLVRVRTGQDIRRLGSGSTGARNVGRALGSNGFVLTMVGDLAKGGVAVWLAFALTGGDRVALLALLAVVAGHVWPPQLGFRGGKGVATSLAGLLIYDCELTLVYCLVFALGFVLARRSVAASLAAYLSLPVASFCLKEDHAHVWGVSVLAGLVLLAHHQNMTRGIHELLPQRQIAREADPSVKEL